MTKDYIERSKQNLLTITGTDWTMFTKNVRVTDIDYYVDSTSDKPIRLSISIAYRQIYTTKAKSDLFYCNVSLQEFISIMGYINKDYINLIKILIMIMNSTNIISDSFELTVVNNKDSIINILNKCRDKTLLATPEIIKLKLMLM